MPMKNHKLNNLNPQNIKHIITGTGDHIANFRYPNYCILYYYIASMLFSVYMSLFSHPDQYRQTSKTL